MVILNKLVVVVVDMCRPEGHGFCAVLGLKTDVLPILVWKRVWFSRNYGSV